MENIYESPKAYVVEFDNEDLLDLSPTQLETGDEGGAEETDW